MKSSKDVFYITLLYFFAIIFVVLGHTGCGISLFADWFPYDSFHMPLFFFISGYLYKKESESNVRCYLIKKFKRFIVPLYVINLCYGIIATILQKNGIISYGSEFSLYNYFIAPWFGGNHYVLNGSMWFITQLFVVQVIYVLIRKVLSKIKWKDYLILGCFIFLGFVAVLFSNKGFGVTFDYKMLIVRTMFFMQFYHIGYFYKEKLEKHDKINSMVYFSIIFALQLILINISNSNLYYSTAYNQYSSIIFLPLLTSLTGIFFWLRICKILEPVVSKSKIINYVGKNTWTIMCHHQFALFIINFILSKVSNIINLSSFSYDQFKSNAWYVYSNGSIQMFLVSSVLILMIPLVFKYLYDKYLKGIIINCINKYRPKNFNKQNQ